MVRTLAALALGAILAVGVAMPALSAGVRVTVNASPITDLQIAQRAKLLTLEGKGANAQKAATDELINEALELQEAKRLGITVTDAQVSDGLLSVARNIKVSPDKLAGILSARGVGIDTLRDRIRAAVAWGKVTQGVISARVQFSEADLEKQAASKVTTANSFDYILKQVMFVMPGGKGSASARTADANRYRSQYKGCDSAVELSTHFTDAAVVDIGRRHATQLPEALAKELSQTGVNGITRPHTIAGGVQLLAVCSKEVARDLTFVTNQLRQSTGNNQLKAETDKYLADLKSKAKIVYG